MCNIKFSAITIILVMVVNDIFGALYFSDGAIHNINFTINDDVVIDYEAPGIQTTLNLLAGGRIGNSSRYSSLTAYNDSNINISAGGVYGDLNAGDRSQLVISGYVIGSVYANGNSQLVLSGISLPAGGWLRFYDDSRVIISGGALFDSAGNALYDLSSIPLTIIGSNFALDGNPVGFGTYTAEMFAGHPRLTCSLANGGEINLRPILGQNSSIILIPEPATVLLLGFGGLLLRMRIR